MLALLKTEQLTTVPKGTWGKHESIVVMSCPKCGKLGRLDDHTIDAYGTVTPSVVCPRKECTFHDHVKLLGWEVTK